VKTILLLCAFFAVGCSGVKDAGSSDTTKDVFIIGVPAGSNTYNVYYQVGASAIACAGDFGTGAFTLQ
jgi:hypothetical protein